MSYMNRGSRFTCWCIYIFRFLAWKQRTLLYGEIAYRSFVSIIYIICSYLWIDYGSTTWHLFISFSIEFEWATPIHYSFIQFKKRMISHLLSSHRSHILFFCFSFLYSFSIQWWKCYWFDFGKEILVYLPSTQYALT